MFTVKAVTESDVAGHERIQLFQCASVRVEPVTVAQTCGVGDPRVPMPSPIELEVTLLDENRAHIDGISLGRGAFNWNVVYVINERGKTVQTIEPPSARLPRAL